MNIRGWLKRTLSHRERVAAMPGAQWLSPLLNRAELWRLERGSVATGLALGVFFGVLIPIGQILLAGFAAWLLRANLASAVLGTLVSNPVTVPFLYALAYGAGALVLGADPMPEPISLSTVGKPLAVGLALLAVTAAAAVYACVHAAWRLAVWRRAARLSALRWAATPRERNL